MSFSGKDSDSHAASGCRASFSWVTSGFLFFFFCSFHDLNTFKDYRRIQFADSHSIWFNVSSEADSLCTPFEKNIIQYISVLVKVMNKF